MLCSACGGNPSDDSWKKGPVKLRYTGQVQHPYVAVCERCGCDVDYQPRASSQNTERMSVLGRLAVGPTSPSGLFQP